MVTIEMSLLRPAIRTRIEWYSCSVSLVFDQTCLETIKTQLSCVNCN